MSVQAFRDAVQAAGDRGQPTTLWLRDDDATVPTAALETLLEMTGRHGVPTTLAVIPAGSGQALADRLAGERAVAVAVHGWAHHNHAGREEKKQELGPQRAASVVLGELARGLRHLKSLHLDQALPVLVPPWNRIDAGVTQGLAGVGFTALSVFGPERPAPLRMVNTHVDLIDWRGSGRAKDMDTLLAEISRALPRYAPIGILTHHLIHDAGAWAVLEGLLALTAGQPHVTWAGLPVLLGHPPINVSKP